MTKCDDGVKCLLNVEFCDQKEECLDWADEKTELGQGMVESELWLV